MTKAIFFSKQKGRASSCKQTYSSTRSPDVLLYVLHCPNHCPNLLTHSRLVYTQPNLCPCCGSISPGTFRLLRERPNHQIIQLDPLSTPSQPGTPTTGRKARATDDPYAGSHNVKEKSVVIATSLARALTSFKEATHNTKQTDTSGSIIHRTAKPTHAFAETQKTCWWRQQYEGGMEHMYVHVLINTDCLVLNNTK